MSNLANDTYAVQALRYWFNASGLAVSVVTDFQRTVDYYRSKGSFMDGFGGAVRTVALDRVKSAMEKLARTSGASFPSTSDFFNALAAEVGTPTFGQVAAAAGDGVLAAGSAALDFGKSSLMLYVAIAAIGVFVIPQLLKKGALGK
jgi:hypothetical protein